MYEYGTLKPVKVILRRGRRNRENTRGDKPKRSALYAYKKCHSENPCKNITN
jgi:hypothetical protein